MKPKPPDVNELLEAVRQVGPFAPGPEWQTRVELLEAAKRSGKPISRDQLEKRIQKLNREGKVEILRAPRRGIGQGVAVYYKLKRNGKPGKPKPPRNIDVSLKAAEYPG